MPTLTKSKGRTETGTAPKAPVVVNAKLAELCTLWGQAEGQASHFFARVASLVQKLKIPKDQIKEALMTSRGVKEATANVDASILERLKAHPDAIAKTLKKEMSVRELRKFGAKPQEEPDKTKQSKKIRNNLVKLAELAIEAPDLSLDKTEWLGWSSEAYRQAKSNLAGAVASGKTKGKNRLTEALEDDEVSDEDESFEDTDETGEDEAGEEDIEELE